ncbi:MAG: IMP dehydrogenase [Cytophagales bacterium]|nr:IMP dehydrogenase [Cytophagales bacterium]
MAESNNYPKSQNDPILSMEEGIAYDDVLLVPAYADILPDQVRIETQLTRNISIMIPVLSSAMDTVTESSMAIAMALSGGIGCVHKNMSISRQVEEIRKVKRFQSGMILDPIYLEDETTLREAVDIIKRHRIGGIPIVKKDKTLVGIVTNRDLRFLKSDNRPISSVMTPNPLITGRVGIGLEEAAHILQQHKIEKLPIVDEKGVLKGLITYKDILKKSDHPHATRDSYGRLQVGAALGLTEDVFLRVKALKEAEVDFFVIDTAHAHSKGVISLAEEIKKTLDIDLVVGNIATAEAAKSLIKIGVDAVKVGIGPGSICTTRVIAGVGVPQFTAVANVSSVARKNKIPVIADGGIRYSGDIVKALAIGADSVMMGSLLAGTDETPGEVIILQGKKYKTYRGMGSVESMQQGSSDRYFQAPYTDSKKLVPEGVVGQVPYRGPVAEVLHQLVGGIRSGMGYCGAKDLSELRKTQFIRVTPAGVRESHPHDVIITREAPNYSG